MAVGIKHLRLDADLHAPETRARLGLSFAPVARAIVQNVGVVHLALVSGTNLNRLHPSRLLNGYREYEIPIGVGTLGRQREGFVGRENELGLAQVLIRLISASDPATTGAWRASG